MCFIRSCTVTLLLLASAGSSQAQWLQRFDDSTMISIQLRRSPKKTGFFMFMSNSNSYGDIAVPTGLFVAGAIRNDI